MSNAIDKIRDAIEEYKKQKAALQATCQASFGEACNEFFTAQPEVVAFTWTQYTPYFNDGDACEFSRGEIAAVAADPEAEGEIAAEEYQGISVWDGDTVVNGYEAKRNPTPLTTATIAFVDELERIPEEIYQEMFGDHVSVVVTRKGVEVFEYEHD